MSLTAPLLLILASILLLILGKRRAGLITLLISTAAFLWAGSGLGPQLALDGLQIHPYVIKPQWHKRNLIVLLGAGTVRWKQEPSDIITFPAWAYSRIFEAARLYYDCKKTAAETCKVLTSGGDPKGHDLPEAEVMANSLKELNIPPGDLILETKSHNTFQNARFSSPLIREAGFDRIYLVTSGFHMRRARLDFNYFNVATEPAPSDHLHAVRSLIPLSFNFILFDVALHEFAGILQFHFYNLMGWNAPPPA